MYESSYLQRHLLFCDGTLLGQEVHYYCCGVRQLLAKRLVSRRSVTFHAADQVYAIVERVIRFGPPSSRCCPYTCRKVCFFADGTH